MQTDYKLLYKLVAEENSLQEQLCKDVGNFIFSKTYENLREPTKLILKLRGVGSWYLRKKRMETILEMFPVDENWYLDQGFSKYTLFKYENRKKIQGIFTERLKDYELYITERNKTSAIRHETQPLLVPLDKSDEVFKSS